MNKKLFILCAFLLLLLGCVGQKPKDPVSVTLIQDAFKEGIQAADQLAKAPTPPDVSINDAIMAPDMMDVAGSEVADKRNQRFDLAVEDVPAKGFFMGLVEDTSYNMVLHPEVSGNISLNLKNVTIDEVLKIVRNVYGYEYKVSAVGYEILPISVQTKIYKLDYLFMSRTGNSSLEVSSGGLSSETGSSTSSSQVTTTITQNIWEEINNILTGFVGTDQGQEISVSAQSGVIVVKAMPEEHRRIEEFLDAMQRSLNRQVILEAKVLEVRLSDAFQQGINWASIAGRLKSSQLGGGTTLSGSGINSATSVSSIAGNAADLKPVTGSDFATTTEKAFGGIFAATFRTSDFSALIELLNSQGNVQVLSSPRVSTLNNQKAIIKVGQDEYFVTNVSSSSSGTSSSTSSDISLQPFFSGIALDVTPFIGDNDYVTLHVHPSITTVSEANKVIVVDGKNQSLPMAKSTVRESDSVIRSKSGQLVIIGGLMKHETTEISTSIPFVDKIPLIGNLFRQKKQEKVKSELVILIRPVILSEFNWKTVLEETDQRIRALDRGFYTGAKQQFFGSERETQETP